MSNSTALATADQRQATLRNALVKMAPEFSKALPGHITADRFVRTAQTAIALTRNIDRVRNPQSLLAACTKAAADGLILDGREAALVIDYNGEAQYRPMIRGLLKLAYQSGELKGIVVEVVRQGDVFRHRPTNLLEPITHEIDHDAERGEPRVVYAMAELKEGGIVHEVMSVAAINRIRDRSDGWKAFQAGKIKSTPWGTDWEEMARKTVFRRLSKYLPSSNEKLHQAAERPDDAVTIDGEAVETTPPTTTKAPAGPKTRGGAAAALRAVQPVQQPLELDPEREPAEQTGFDLETGEILETRADYPGDDI
ncbi:recombinase RecT [Hyphomicrobium sp. 99]|uniref:recombinase RecT n=1 Tax=Hyphomicrobium sp. 99 TaxID=1163419 RepID=UPI0009E3504C|nr:recombinase RecT [Hyphomicrobium sp. 99]